MNVKLSWTLVPLLFVPKICTGFLLRPLLGGKVPHPCKLPIPTDDVSIARASSAFHNEASSDLSKLDCPSSATVANNESSPPLFSTFHEWESYLRSLPVHERLSGRDLLWEQIKLDATAFVQNEAEAGPLIYQAILSQPSLLTAICTVISHQIESPLIPATEIKSLFLEALTPEDEFSIRLDLQAVATRSPTYETAMEAMLFHNGFHALCCYRLGHRLWEAERRGLAYYMQSTVSRAFSCDIHPACRMGHGIFMRAGAGVVIGETATIGNDVSILEGVTLGGTGKETGNRHPKVGNGVIIHDGGTVLGNIPVADGSVVSAKSIVTKPLPPLAIACGVPAKITSYRNLDEPFLDDLEHHLTYKYLTEWKELQAEQSQ